MLHAQEGAASLLAGAAQALRCTHEIPLEQAARHFSSLGAGPLHGHSTGSSDSFTAHSSLYGHTRFHMPPASRSFSTDLEPGGSAPTASGGTLLDVLSGACMQPSGPIILLEVAWAE